MMHDLPKHRLHDPEAIERKWASVRRGVTDLKWFRKAAANRTDMAVWFVAKTNRACPMKMAVTLRQYDIEAWCPVDREKKRAPRRHGRTLVEWPLFDGYLFVRIDHDPASILGVSSFKGIAGLIGKDGKPTVMPEKFVNELKLFSFLSPKQRRLMCSAVRVGDRVKINRYVFGNHTGEVVRMDGERGFVDIEFDIFGQLVPVTAGLDEVEKLD